MSHKYIWLSASMVCFFFAFLFLKTVYAKWTNETDPPTTKITVSGPNCVAVDSKKTKCEGVTSGEVTLECRDASLPCEEIRYHIAFGNNAQCPDPVDDIDQYSSPPPTEGVYANPFPVTNAGSNAKTICAFSVDGKGNIQQNESKHTITFPSIGSPWIQTIGGDVHSNTSIDAPAAP